MVELALMSLTDHTVYLMPDTQITPVYVEAVHNASCGPESNIIVYTTTDANIGKLFAEHGWTLITVKGRYA